MINLKNEMTDNFFKAVLALETVDECYKFFEDVCTIKEIKSFSQRLEVARMLKNKQLYNDIVAATGASTATISRVNRSLTYGNDGYEIVLSRMKDE